METDLQQHPRADELRFPLPDGWCLQNKEEYGDTVWFCQHPESMLTTKTHDSPETAAQYAHQKHQSEIAPNHTLPWEKDQADEEAGITKMTNAQMTNGQMTNDEILDEDNGEYVEVTPKMKAEARQAISRIQASILVTAYWIARIYDERLYVALGYNTKSAFVEDRLPFGTRQARKYAKVGRRMSSFLPSEVKQDELPAPGDSDSDAENGEVPDSLQGLPMGKLHKLTQLDEEDLEDYVEEGEWTGPNGETYTRDDVIEMARTELGDAVAEKVQNMRDTLEQEKEKRQAYEELAAKRKEEKEAVEEKLDEEKDRIETAQDLERRLGPTASKLQEKRETLDECAEHLDEAIRLAGKIGITEDDPEADQMNLQRLLQRAQTLKDVIHEDYAEVLMSLGL
jgi:hypothetical protein